MATWLFQAPPARTGTAKRFLQSTAAATALVHTRSFARKAHGSHGRSWASSSAQHADHTRRRSRAYNTPTISWSKPPYDIRWTPTLQYPVARSPTIPGCSPTVCSKAQQVNLTTVHSSRSPPSALPLFCFIIFRADSIVRRGIVRGLYGELLYNLQYTVPRVVNMPILSIYIVNEYEPPLGLAADDDPCQDRTVRRAIGKAGDARGEDGLLLAPVECHVEWATLKEVGAPSPLLDAASDCSSSPAHANTAQAPRTRQRERARSAAPRRPTTSHERPCANGSGPGARSDHDRVQGCGHRRRHATLPGCIILER